MNKKPKTPWPTKAVMQQIYDQHLWGGKAFDFYSGEGSHHPKIIDPYLNVVISFLQSHKNTLTVCDLGCGDFNIGKHLVPFAKTYIAIDIVPNLIDRNKRLYTNNNLEFHCLDIAKDPIPTADCVILRQVLQHLSNDEIKNIVKKLSDYKFVILTEHLPNDAFIPNKAIISGQGIRLKHNSGVNVLAEPFNLHVKTEDILNEFILKNEKGRIVTTLYTMP